jgi:hypothetical protein
MEHVGQDEHDAADRDGKPSALDLIRGAYLALATLLGAFVDLQSSWNSRSVALLLAAFVVTAAVAIGILRRQGKLTGSRFTRALIFVLFGVVLAAGVMTINLWKSQHRSELVTISSVVIDDRGARDGGDLFLNREPKSNCNCQVGGSALRTDDDVRAHCQVQGTTWIYNANLVDVNAVRNDEFFKSKRWYRATDSDGRSGYISEVWVKSDDRGGLDLPDCRRG